MAKPNRNRIVLQPGEFTTIRCGPGQGEPPVKITKFLSEGQTVTVTCKSTNTTTLVKCGKHARQSTGTITLKQNQAAEIHCNS